MSALEKTSSNIKKKLSLSDYQTDVQQNTNTTIQHTVQQEVSTAKQQKVKVTVYLTEDSWEMFNELCVIEMKREGKPEKSQIICDAIKMLHANRAGKN